MLTVATVATDSIGAAWRTGRASRTGLQRKDGRDRGVSRLDYLLAREELEQVTAARAHPYNRRNTQD